MDQLVEPPGADLGAGGMPIRLAQPEDTAFGGSLGENSVRLSTSRLGLLTTTRFGNGGALCEELGIGFVAYSPLGRGFLTGNVTDIAALRAGDVRRNMPRFQGDNLRRNLKLIEELKRHAAAENCTLAQLALAWVLSRASYIVPIPGTSHCHRLEENAAAASLNISSDTEEALLKVFAGGAASGLRYPENHLKRLGI